MTKIKDIVAHLEAFAPPAYQEDYDNSGLIVGDAQREVTGIIISLDCIEKVIEEAIEKDCNLIVSHHPIVFGGLKKLTGANYVERTVMMAIRNDIAIYAIHTNLDHVQNGVNHKIAEKLGLINTHVLRPKTSTLNKLTTFIPKENTDIVMQKLHEAGAGEIGNYKHCSFRLEGQGTFLPSDKALPAIGEVGKLEKVDEDRVELIFPYHKKSQVLAALFSAHPYEEVAYYLHALINEDKGVGAGLIGELTIPADPNVYLSIIKDKLNVSIVRHTQLIKNKIGKVAVCGGSGAFLLKDAIRQKADIFITGDFKYHEFFDAEQNIIIADVGHYESEQFTKELIYELLREKFANIALHFTEVNTNPIFYA